MRASVPLQTARKHHITLLGSTWPLQQIRSFGMVVEGDAARVFGEVLCFAVAADTGINYDGLSALLNTFLPHTTLRCQRAECPLASPQAHFSFTPVLTSRRENIIKGIKNIKIPTVHSAEPPLLVALCFRTEHGWCLMAQGPLRRLEGTFHPAW